MLKRSFILAAFACTQFLNPVTAQNSARSGFQSLNVQQFISSNRISVSAPKQVAVQLFRDRGEEEGRQSEEISVSYPTGSTAAIVHTVVGLADDSVAGIRHRIELRRRQNRWEIVWVGRQTRCRQGRGHQNWAGRACI